MGRLAQEHGAVGEVASSGGVHELEWAPLGTSGRYDAWLDRCGVPPCTQKAPRLRGFLRIGAPRFELGTSPTRTVRATRLRHAPKSGQYRAGVPAGSTR